jgi:hypothetical protein
MAKEKFMPDMTAGMKTKSAPKSKMGGKMANKKGLDTLPKPGSKPQKVAKHTSKRTKPVKDASAKRM